MVTVLPGSARPVMVMVLSAVTPSPCLPVSRLKLVKNGAEGAVASTVMATVLLGRLGFSVSGSVCTAVKLCLPSATAGVVSDQTPEAFTVAVPTFTPSM